MARSGGGDSASVRNSRAVEAWLLPKTSKDAWNGLGVQAAGHRAGPPAESPYPGDAQPKHGVGTITESTSGQCSVGLQGLGCHQDPRIVEQPECNASGGELSPGTPTQESWHMD